MAASSCAATSTSTGRSPIQSNTEVFLAEVVHHQQSRARVSAQPPASVSITSRPPNVSPKRYDERSGIVSR